MVEHDKDITVDPDVIFATLEHWRRTGELHNAVVGGKELVYQLSKTVPGNIERVNSNGITTTGKWVDGKFMPYSPL